MVRYQVGKLNTIFGEMFEVLDTFQGYKFGMYYFYDEALRVCNRLNNQFKTSDL